MARSPKPRRDPMSRDTALILLAGVTVVVVVAAIVALVISGQVDSTTAIAALSGPGAVGGTAVGRLSGANAAPVAAMPLATPQPLANLAASVPAPEPVRIPTLNESPAPDPESPCEDCDENGIPLFAYNDDGFEGC